MAEIGGRVAGLGGICGILDLPRAKRRRQIVYRQRAAGTPDKRLGLRRRRHMGRALTLRKSELGAVSCAFRLTFGKREASFIT